MPKSGTKSTKFQFALPRGERLEELRCFFKELAGFQFALPRGERLRSATMPSNGSLFQFALPRGERQSKGLAFLIFNSFNSRSRVGSDGYYNTLLQ